MNKTFCAAPWTHIHAWATGEVFPCCFAEASSEKSYGNLKTSTFSEVINSEKMTELRRDMLAGKPNASCEKCYKAEEHAMTSYRAMFNQEFLAGAQEALSRTNDAGEVDPEYFKVKYWDVRISNLCNMKCRTCGPEFSTKWYDEVSASHKDIIGTDRLLKIRNTYESLLDEVPNFFENVEKIYFAGGEPLIMDEHWSLIDQLIKARRTDVILEYQTNLAKLTYKNRSLDEILNTFQNVRVMASIDDDIRGNSIRHGQSVQKVLNNVRYIRDSYPNVDFWISCTVSKLNVFKVVDFYLRLVKDNLIDPVKFTINPVYDPDYYSIGSLPDNLKKKLKNTMDLQLERARAVASPRLLQEFESLLSFAGSYKNNKSKHYEFFDVSAKMDSLRKEQSFKEYPEYFANTPKDLQNALLVGNFANADIEFDLSTGINSAEELIVLRDAVNKNKSKSTLVLDLESVKTCDTITRLGSNKIRSVKAHQIFSTKTEEVNIETGSMLLGICHALNFTMKDLLEIKCMPSGIIILSTEEFLLGLNKIINRIDLMYSNKVYTAALHFFESVPADYNVLYYDWPTVLLAIKGVSRLDHVHR